MENSLTATASTKINVPISKVWQALTDPAIIKQYLFGTDTVTDWKKGSDIRYRGVWQGKPYEDKGKIIEIVPEKKLHTTYLSGNSGKEDKPENYNNVIYTLESEYGRTIITITQDNVKDAKEQEHAAQNWNTVLENMKKVLEQYPVASDH